ncbi:MAG: hypothetical protein ABL927_09230 [Bdellovibrionales bacterium]
MMNTINSDQLLKDAKVLSRHLLGVSPSPVALQLYCEYVKNKTKILSPAESRLWALVLKFPILISIVDSGLQVVDHYHPIRHRIYIMSCILESQPELSHYFLPKSFSKTDKIKLIFDTASAILQLGIGIVFSKMALSLFRCTEFIKFSKSNN